MVTNMSNNMSNLTFLFQQASLSEIKEVYRLINYLQILEIFILTVKLYKILLFFAIIMKQLPLFNPFKWPLIIINRITSPFLKAIRSLIPRIIIGPTFMDITNIMAITLSGALVHGVMQLSRFPYRQLEILLLELIHKYS